MILLKSVDIPVLISSKEFRPPSFIDKSEKYIERHESKELEQRIYSVSFFRAVRHFPEPKFASVLYAGYDATRPQNKTSKFESPRFDDEISKLVPKKEKLQLCLPSTSRPRV